MNGERKPLVTPVILMHTLQHSISLLEKVLILIKWSRGSQYVVQREPV